MPKPWPYNQIREPRPADWGIGMTVCIACPCIPEGCLVGMTDSMVSMPDMSADNLAIKYTSLGSRWVAMFAGNDISPVTPILKAVRPIMHDSERETLAETVAAFQKAFRMQILNKAESTILSRFGMDMTEFRASGLANFGAEIFTRLVYEVEQVSLDLTFLVGGFDLEDPAFSSGHVFTIQNRGEVTHYDIPGFWAIGSGQTAALGTLFGARSNVKYMGLEDVMYLLAKSKFNAESAPGVGPKTSAFILYPDGSRYLIYETDLERLKSLWKRERPTDVSLKASQASKEIIAKAQAEGRVEDATQSKSQTSTQEP
jgi:hypothetical protein